ncbi:MAG: VWA domain-containing protein [bacterium]|nr:VWA domain-containing protein [bacterium]
MCSRRHLLPLLVALLLPLAPPAPAQGQGSGPTGTELPLTPEARSQGLASLAPQYVEWLRSVRGLITQPEQDYFLRLEEDFRRDLFMRAFWEPRDPDPATRGNELKERFDEYRGKGDVPYDDPRFLLVLFNGPPGAWSLPDGRPVAICFSKSRELEIWFYGASERTARRFPVILQRRSGEAPYEAYLPGQGLRPIQRSGGLPTTNLQALCADDLLRYTISEISRITGYDQLLREVLSPLLPSPEWLANLASSATDLPRDAETFDAGIEIDFPARKQSRAAVRVMLGVPLTAAPGRRFDGELFHNFQLVGEVVRDGKLFESFRYGYEGPTPPSATTIPIGFTRYLRAGGASLRILIEDLYSGRFARVVREIEIPAADGLPAAVGVPMPVSEQRPSGPTLELYPPPGNVHVGKVRFRARASGELEKVTFYLDDRPALSKRRPPYSVELDLGSSPEPHRVRVVGFFGGAEVATDQIWLNQGAQRFRVHLIEPRPGGIYPGSLTARVGVETPDGGPPERVELFLNDELLETFRDGPVQRSLRLSGQEPAVVRAVAYLADGTSSEDAVVVNTSGFTAAIEVRLTELHALVSDSRGQPIRGLGREKFRVFENGVEQRIELFAEAGSAPVRAALLLDRSVSMESQLERVAEASLAFATAAMAMPEDRLAVLSFAEQLTIDAALTANAATVERALAGLDAGGRTALWDGLVQAFNTFDGGDAPSALVLFTDGQDDSSRLSFDQAMTAARGAGITLYVIGLEESFPEKRDRRPLGELVAETGGRAAFIGALDELDGLYASILEELRGRYLLGYSPASAAEAGAPRAIRVEVDAPGARVRTRRGIAPL